MREMNLCCRKLNVVGIFYWAQSNVMNAINSRSCSIRLATFKVLLKIRTQASKGFALGHQRRKLLQNQRTYNLMQQGSFDPKSQAKSGL
jgi:hypothetical protein